MANRPGAEYERDRHAGRRRHDLRVPDGRTAPAQQAPATRSAVEPELAAPQVRLDRELPRPSQIAVRPAGGAGGNRTAGGVLAPYILGDEDFTRSIRSLEPISDLEAAAFAGRFATDFQSFDEDDPTTRADVLRPLLADPRASTWGWSGGPNREIALV